MKLKITYEKITMRIKCPTPEDFKERKKKEIKRKVEKCVCMLKYWELEEIILSMFIQHCPKEIE